MDQQKAGSGENLLTRVYKNLFVNNKEQESLENELKISKILDKEGGVFGLSENRVFNFDAKNDIFGGITREKTIFDLKNDPRLGKISKPRPAPRDSQSDIKNPLDTDVLKNLSLNKAEKPENSGNNFDQMC